MPNWCDNELTIKGDPAEVQRCLDAIKEQPKKDEKVSAHEAEGGEDEEERSMLSFQSILPMPESLNVTDGSVGDEALVAWHGDEAGDLMLKLDPHSGIVSRYKENLKGLMKRHKVKTVEALRAKLHKIDPEAENLANAYLHNLKTHGAKTWYNWSIKNWGTKWDCNEAHEKSRSTDKKGKLSVTIRFDTAWSPPEPIVNELGRQFPDLCFRLKWWECGCGAKGTIVVLKGEQTKNESSDYRGGRGG